MIVVMIIMMMTVMMELMMELMMRGCGSQGLRSTHRYPVSRAHFAARYDSPGLPSDANVPKPRAGILTPLLRVKVRPVDILCKCSGVSLLVSVL